MLQNKILDFIMLYYDKIDYFYLCYIILRVFLILLYSVMLCSIIWYSPTNTINQLGPGGHHLVMARAPGGDFCFFAQVQKAVSLPAVAAAQMVQVHNKPWGN